MSGGGQLSRGAPARRCKNFMAAPSKSFVTRCKEEGLTTPSRVTEARPLLAGANVECIGSAAELKELAAALVWARAHLDGHDAWEQLDAEAQGQLAALYPGAKAAAGASAMAKIRRAVSYHTTPKSSPVKPAGGAGAGVGAAASDGSDGVAAALLAVAQAREAEKDKAAKRKAQGGVAASGGGSAVDARPGPQDPFGLDRDADDEAGPDGSGGAAGGGGPRAAAPARRGGIGKRLFSELVRQPSGGRNEAGLHRIEFKLSRQELLDLLPGGRAHAMDLTHNWTDARRTTHRKAQLAGTAEEVTSAYHINFIDLANARKLFTEIGEALALAARWKVDRARVDGSRRKVRGARARRAEDLEVWNRVNFLTESELPASDLSELQEIVQEFYADRAEEAAEELEGCPGTEEVSAGIERQACQIPTLFEVLGKRIGRKQGGAGGTLQARGKLHNASWRSVLTPFFKEHIVEILEEDTSSMLADFDAELEAAERAAFGKAGAGGVGSGGSGSGGGCAAPVRQVARKSVGVAGAGGGAGQQSGARGAAGGGVARRAAGGGRALPPPAAMAGGAAAGAPAGTWVGLPESTSVVGGLGQDRANARCRRCLGGDHRTFECVLNYAEILGEACPGFTAAGLKVPADWAGGNLTAAARARWVDYAARHALQPSKNAVHRVDFS